MEVVGPAGSAVGDGDPPTATGWTAIAPVDDLTASQDRARHMFTSRIIVDRAPARRSEIADTKVTEP